MNTILSMITASPALPNSMNIMLCLLGSRYVRHINAEAKKIIPPDGPHSGGKEIISNDSPQFDDKQINFGDSSQSAKAQMYSDARPHSEQKQMNSGAVLV
jgi:hypothetical protein